MPPKKRQRYSAFEDFPAEDSITEVKDRRPLPQFTPTKDVSPVERIERLKPSQIIPDRFQPRRLLPFAIRDSFYSGKMDCYQTAGEWLKLSHKDDGVRLETDRLLAMGDSFDQHGQIKPITGSWVPAAEGQFVFMIETGERRFWAACLQHIISKNQEEPLLRIEVVKNPTRQRQVLENRHAEPPTAVSQACEIASLILAEMEILPDTNLDDEFNYFRQARAQRMPAGLWERIMPIMQLTRPRMVQLLNILQLPSHLLDLANRYQISERVLREVLLLPDDQWEKMIRLSIHNNLTSDDISRMVEVTPIQPNKKSATSSLTKIPSRTATGGLRRFFNAIINLDEVSRSQTMDEIADDLVVSGQSDRMLDLMNELSSLLSARLSRKQ